MTLTRIITNIVKNRITGVEVYIRQGDIITRVSGIYKKGENTKEINNKIIKQVYNFYTDDKEKFTIHPITDEDNKIIGIEALEMCPCCITKAKCRNLDISNPHALSQK